MTTRTAAGSSSGITMLLRGLAVLQGISIVALVVLLNGGGAPAPTNASPRATQTTADAASPSAAGIAQGSPAPQPAAPGSAAAGTAADGATAGGAAPATAPPAPLASNASGAAAAAERDAMGIVLYGRVLDEAGQPVTEGWVMFTNPANDKQLAQVSLGREQSFAVAGIAPGEVAYRSRVTGYQEASGTIPIPPGTPQVRHDIVLTKSWEITVRILTPEGKPVRAALAELSKDRPNLHRVDVGAVASSSPPTGDFPLTSLREITAGIGKWRSASGLEGRMVGGKQMPIDVAGILELGGRQPIWVSAVLRHRVLATVPVEPGTTEVVLTVGVDRVMKDLCTIRGRVVDAATKEPVTTARVGFGDRQSSGGGAPVDAEGRFEGRDLRPGLLTLEVRANARSTPYSIVAVEPGQVLDLGDVLVSEIRTYAGRVEGMTGKADACRITVVPLDPPSHASLRPRDGSSRVEADGSFKLSVTDGRYRLRVSGAGGALMDIDTRTLGTTPLVVQLAKEVMLRVDVKEPFELAVFDAAGRELYRRDLQHGWKLSLPCTLGEYRAELKDGRGTVTTQRLTLGDTGADLRVP